MKKINEKIDETVYKNSDEHPFGYFEENENDVKNGIFEAFEMFESNQRCF